MDQTSSTTDNVTLPPLKTAGGQIKTLHIAVIALSLIMTLGAWKYTKTQVDTQAEIRFNIARDRALHLIKDRMERYEDALNAGAAAIKSHGGDMSHNQWRTFSKNLHIAETYPGINGIGVIHFLTPAHLPAYLKQRRAERPDFRIHPSHKQGYYMPISFVEPEQANSAAIGLDLAHEINRRSAAFASRDSGKAQITGPIVLVQDAGNTPGFLFLIPFYGSDIPMSVADRKGTAKGAVYAPFVVKKLMEGLLAKNLRHVRFDITDAGQKIYNEHDPDAPFYDPDPMFQETITLDIYGRKWSIDMRSSLAFRDANTNTQPTMVLIAGLLIEALVIALMILMARANHNAVAYAERMTVALRQKTEKLAKTNQELEQFVYITSHDLRTPLRGIGGLSEMVLEDLDDYFAGPNANPEVAENLGLILQRVNHMNALTQGILEISKTRKTTEAGPELSLNALVKALIHDFNLASDQITLVGTARTIKVDTSNFQRVLENLVGNAVKYHTSKTLLKITISAQETETSYQISVQDNGSGIDPRYHKRIFDLFQTLRTDDIPESTGIGLSVVKKVVESHGGKITLDSDTGQGAKFSFEWPKHNSSIHQFQEKKAA